MYETYFGLSSAPFSLLPDPDFHYLSQGHKRALNSLDYGIRTRAAFILLTGEIGSGKTTLIRTLLRRRYPKACLAKVFNTKVSSEQLIALINEDFGLDVGGKDKVTMLRELHQFLIQQASQDKNPILIVDEAQNLSKDVLEEIRLLSNLEGDNLKLLQIILVGQPELRDKLASSDLTQLRQRISINCHLLPLNQSEVERYILHRLEQSGGKDAVTFSDECHALIYQYSRGIPRLINIICDYLMLAAFAAETKTIKADLVKSVLQDLDFERQYWGQPTAEPSASLAQIADEHDGLRDLIRHVLVTERHCAAMDKRLAHIEELLEREDGNELAGLMGRLESMEAMVGKALGNIHEALARSPALDRAVGQDCLPGSGTSLAAVEARRLARDGESGAPGLLKRVFSFKRQL